MKKTQIELGKEYNFAGYRWVPVRINEEDQVAVMQSLGVTAGPWPGFSMGKFGNGDYYNRDITRRNISDYDDKTRVLMEQIRPIVSGDVGLYLPSYDNIKTNSVQRDALAKAAANYRSFSASNHCAWTGTYYGGGYAWVVNSSGNVDYGNQSVSFVVPAAFDLDLSKVEIEEDEIKEKVVLASEKSFVNPVQPLINKLHKQAEETQKLLNLAADTIETCTAESAYMHERFLDGLPVHRQGDDESDGIECPICKYEVARNDDYPDERPCHCPNCGTKLIYC